MTVVYLICLSLSPCDNHTSFKRMGYELIFVSIITLCFIIINDFIKQRLRIIVRNNDKRDFRWMALSELSKLCW